MVEKHRIKNDKDTWVITVPATIEELDVGVAPKMDLLDGDWQVVFDGWDVHVHSSQYDDEPSVPLRAMKLYVEELSEWLK